jgi:CheY-like chemotaxis protein
MQKKRPGLSGHERLGGHPRKGADDLSNLETSTIPVVMLSARAGEESVVAGLDTRADDHVVKPFSARELISPVATHLELARLRHNVATAAYELAQTRAALRDELARKPMPTAPTSLDLRQIWEQLGALRGRGVEERRGPRRAWRPAAGRSRRWSGCWQHSCESCDRRLFRPRSAARVTLSPPNPWLLDPSAPQQVAQLAISRD